MGKNTFGKTMPRALSQNLKIMGEQIKGGTWRPNGFYGHLCACTLCT